MSTNLFSILLNLIVIALGIVAWWWCNKKYKETKSRPMINCLPGVFTSLGLLGTFISICWSLKSWNPDTTESKFITDLISNLIPAFTTSIIGLIGALGATIWTKYIFAKEEAKEDNNMGHISPEMYIREIALNTKEVTTHKSLLEQNNKSLTQLIKFQKDQEAKNRENVQNLNRNINEQSAILKKFIDDFVNRMDDIFKQMHGSIQQQVLNFGKEQLEQTSDLLKTIAERLSKDSNNILENQRQSVTLMMKQTNEELSNITTTLKDVLAGLTKDMQTSLATLNTQQSEQLTSIITNVDALVSTLSQQNVDFAKQVTRRMQSDFKKTQEHNSQSLNLMMQTTQSEIGSITTTIKNALGDLTNELQTSLTQLNTQQSERINSIITNYDSLATKLSQQNSDFAQKVTNQIREDYLKVEEHSTKSLEQMTELRNSFQEVTSTMVDQNIAMNKQVTSDLHNSMTGLVTEIQNVITSHCNTLGKAIEDNVKGLGNAYKFIETHVAEIRQNYEQVVVAFDDAVKTAHGTNANSEKMIAANNKSLQAVEETNKKIAEILDLLSTRQDNIERLTKQIGSVSGAIEELQKLESTINKIANNK